jgi:hypothetical protein
MAEAPSVSDAAQRSESVRKTSFLNYKSAALPAELSFDSMFIVRVCREPLRLTRIL